MAWDFLRFVCDLCFVTFENVGVPIVLPGSNALENNAGNSSIPTTTNFEAGVVCH